MLDQEFLRRKKKIAMEKWYNSFSIRDSLTCCELTDATVLPLHKDADTALQFGRGGVVCDGKYIQESGIEGRVGGYYEHSDEAFCDQKVVYCGALIRQWGHFLVESVSRLWYFLQNDPTVDRYVFISNRSHFQSKKEITGNYRAFFELLGVWDKIEVITVPTRFREVLIPELGYSRKYYYSKEYKELFETVAENAVKQCHHLTQEEKVFLSRSRFPKASSNEFGLNMLDNYFEKNHFKILYPEALPLHEMIWYLRHAEVCAAESGTVPHNYLFCQDEKDCIIIERQATINEIQANIDIIKDLKVSYIDGFYMVYPTLAGYGPYILGYNDLFSAFSENFGYRPPDKQFLSEKNLRNNLRKYFRAYKKAYGYHWGFEKWQLMYGDAYYEAYEDSCKVLGPYLSREKALFWTDYFDTHILKAAIKALLHRIKSINS